MERELNQTKSRNLLKKYIFCLLSSFKKGGKIQTGLNCEYDGLSEACLSISHFNLPGQFSLSGQIFLHWAAATLKGLVQFQNKKI
jgi:hypothetical protein